MSRVVRGHRVVTPDGIRPASIHIDNGRITDVRAFDDAGAGECIEAGAAVIGPGLVDTHVHINQPGREDWEGFLSATRAALAGGVTTLIDMPLNSVPPTTTVQALEEKREAAQGKCFVDVGFLGGVVPGHVAELEGLARAGVFGFKAFLCDSGVGEFAAVSLADLRNALLVLARFDGLLMVHAEDPTLLRAPESGATGRPYQDWLSTRPATAETAAVAQMIALSREFDVRVHVVHVSSPETAAMIRAAATDGVRISAETCPHYLTFAAEEIPPGATEFKCAPPIRNRDAREGLWEALGRGAIDMVVSDHSPAPPHLRLREVGDFFAAWGGIASLQLRLPAVWTEARARGHTVDAVTRWVAEQPARLVGLWPHKGVIAAGADADLVFWHPQREFTVDAAMLRHRHSLTPWLGRRLAGVVEATYLRGEQAFRLGAPDSPARGVLIQRTHP